MGLHKIIINSVKQSFCNKCITLVIEAYNSSISEIHKPYTTDWLENDFTGMLDKYILDNKKRLHWNINCNTEQHLHDAYKHLTKGYANKEKRIDMSMSHISFRNEFHFYIEAKRLKEQDYNLKKRYIETGIDSFISSKYPQGILIGYLIEGDTDNTVKGINDILIKRGRGDEVMVRQNHSIHNNYYESTHASFGTISHFVLDYTI